MKNDGPISFEPYASIFPILSMTVREAEFDRFLSGIPVRFTCSAVIARFWGGERSYRLSSSMDSASPVCWILHGL
jgi:hypothetical protein